MAARRSRQQTTLVKELALGSGVAEAARRSGMSLRTAYRHKDRPEIKAEIAETRRRLLHKATENLAKTADEAVKTLGKLLKAKSESVRLGAARAVLDGLLRFQEAEELTERVKKLEEGQGAVRGYLETLTGEQVEEFYFELHSSLKEKEPEP